MAARIDKLVKKYKNTPIQVKASFWFLVCAFLQKGISMLTTPIFTRLLSATQYGQYNIFNSWMGIISIFVTIKLSMGVYAQGLVKYEEERAIYASSLQGLTAILVLIWTIIYLVSYHFWNGIFSLSTIQMMAMMAMIWSSAVFQFWAAEQRVKFKYKLLVAITLLVSVAKPLVGIVFVVHADDKVTARIIGLALVELIGYSGFFIVQMLRGKKFYVRKFWNNALRFNIPLIPHYLSQTVLSSADRIMIGKMENETSAGIYSLAYSVSQIMTLFNTALMQTISPWIYQKIKTKKTEDIASIAYRAMIIIACVNLLLITAAPEVVAFCAPKSYYEARWVIPPVAMSVYFMFCYDLFAKFAFYYEKTGFIMSASMAGAILNVILNYIFIELFGYRAAGYTTLFCYIVYAVGHYCFMKIVCRQFCDGKKIYDGKIILGITLIFLLSGFALLLTYNNSFIRYGIIVFAIAAIWRKRRWILDIFKFRVL